jgi:hypothetical protein
VTNLFLSVLAVGRHSFHMKFLSFYATCTCVPRLILAHVTAWDLTLCIGTSVPLPLRCDTCVPPLTLSFTVSYVLTEWDFVMRRDNYTFTYPISYNYVILTVCMQFEPSEATASCLLSERTVAGLGTEFWNKNTQILHLRRYQLGFVPYTLLALRVCGTHFVSLTREPYVAKWH